MDDKLDNLMQYCAAQKLIVSPVIAPKHNEVSGLGLHIKSSVKKGQRLIYAPNASLLTTAKIPASFIPSQHVRDDLSVHGLLAAWLAFGDSSTLSTRYGAWMDVWPSWPSFRDSMPVFWDRSFLNISTSSEALQASSSNKRRRLSDRSTHRISHGTDQRSIRDFSLAQIIQGWSPPYLSPHQKPLTEQVSKLHKILAILHDKQELLGFDILADKSRENLTRFLHMWCCVNSRCFYYVPYGKKAPQDPNEAMALVPFLDLFNHSTNGKGADVNFDKTGFLVTADRDYAEGEEIFIQYGSHTNDSLWAEYGFLLDENSHDEINIDQIVIQTLTEPHRNTLESVDYLGNYTVDAFSIGYRLEMAAWLTSGAIGATKWVKFVQGTYDPENEPLDIYSGMRLKTNRQLVNWLLTAKHSCEKSLGSLLPMQRDLERHLHDLLPDFDFLSVEECRDANSKIRVAAPRIEWCIKRWKQIYAICFAALNTVALECPLAVGKNAQERREIMSNMLTHA